MSEHDEQACVIEWANWKSKEMPCLKLLHAIPNQGSGSAVRGKRMKAEGLKSGLPDLSLPIARGRYHGLYIEMKVGSNKPTERQQWWLDRLHEQGYFAIVCWSADEAIAVIENYLRKDEM